MRGVGGLKGKRGAKGGVGWCEDEGRNRMVREYEYGSSVERWGERIGRIKWDRVDIESNSTLRDSDGTAAWR